jgi:hypothetical protein
MAVKSTFMFNIMQASERKMTLRHWDTETLRHWDTETLRYIVLNPLVK